MESKTHYRKVFKSDHLGTPDLEEFIEEAKGLIYTIANVKQYILEEGNRNSGVSVAGRRISANIAYFKENIKPLVLNSTNSKQVSKFANSKFTEDWNNIIIELYIDSSVKMKKEVVEGVRIRPVQPVATKPILTPEHARWEEARKAVAEGKLKGVLAVYDVSEAYQILLQA